MQNIYPIQNKITKVERETLLGQRARLIWFTGLSGSGKSTLAMRLEENLFTRGYKTFLLDGDNIRTGLNNDLSFIDTDRVENIRRIGEVSKLFLDSGIILLSAFISPFQIDRQRVKEIVGVDNFLEVFVDCPLAQCEERDVKGLYKKARKGEILNFTGIHSVYEPPVSPALIIPTHQLSIEESVGILLTHVLPKLSL